MKKFIGITLLFTTVFFGVPAWAHVVEEDQPSAAGAGNQRIEQEDRMHVPLDKVEEVWAFLEERFVNDKEHLKSIDSRLTSYWNLEEFWDTYYDTPSFQVLKAEGGVRHRKRINLTNPSDVKSGRELMQIKTSDVNSNPLSRGEIKFDIEPPLQPTGTDDAYEILHLVKPSQRADFKHQLADFGLDPYDMSSVLVVHDLRRRIYLLRDGQPFMSVSLDRADSRIWWARFDFSELEPELNEIAYTDADATMRGYMEKILGQIVGEIKTEFPYLERDLTPKYSRSYAALEKEIPLLNLLVKTGMHGVHGMVLVILIVAGAIGSAVYFGTRKLRGFTRPQSSTA